MVLGCAAVASGASTVCITSVEAPAVSISNRKSPGESSPGSNRMSGDPSKAPPTLAWQIMAAARTAATCCGRRPGRSRPARMRVISKPWPVMTETASAVRRI
jgi:hypothetical protein